MKGHHVRKTKKRFCFPPQSWAGLCSSLIVALSTCASLLSRDCIDSISRTVCTSQNLSEYEAEIFFLAIFTDNYKMFSHFPNNENTGPLNMRQTGLMLIQRSFLKVNCFINTQIVPSTHYKFAICLIYAQSGKSCKYNAKSRHL